MWLLGLERAGLDPALRLPRMRVHIRCRTFYYRNGSVILQLQVPGDDWSLPTCRGISEPVTYLCIPIMAESLAMTLLPLWCHIRIVSLPA